MKNTVQKHEAPEFSFRHPYSPVQLGGLSSLYSIRIPSVLKVVGWLLVGAFMVIVVALTWIPWVQTTTGTGVVTTLDPRDREQNISALVPGRIAEWYVRDAQFVKAGDPLVRIQDVDDELLSRLEAQLAAAHRRHQAAREAVATSGIDLERRRNLFENGLTSRLELEQASIRVQQLRITEEQALAEMNAAEVNLSRQGSQMVRAPRDGTIVHVEAGDIATLVNAGQTLATFIPADTQRVVELYIEGRDIGLLQAGRKVRLEFDGWPAFQFSGMPQFAVGTFAGEVIFVEPGARDDGRFRVVVGELNLGEGCLDQATRPGLNVAGNCGWPPESYIRLGALARGWVLLETVPLGYELWRMLNNFPPVNSGAGQKVPTVGGGK